MNSQRGKVSTQASRQNKSQKQRQASKSLTNASSRSANKGSRRGRNNNRPGRDQNNAPFNNRFKSLSSGSRSRIMKSHIIDEDEYIQDINGSVAFATTSFPINPGQSGTFPWGYKIAGLYEKYRFLYLEFYYLREVSEYATNGQSGKVMLSVDFDASDGAPSTKQQVLDTIPHEDAMPCTERISLVVDCSQMAKQDSFYVRSGVQPANTDIKTYDAGNLFISTYGCTNSSAIGELHVRYRCEVSVPVLQSGSAQAGQPGSYMEITSNLSGEATGATTVDQALFASATSPVVIANGIGATISTTGLITLLPGVYKVESTCLFSDSTASVTAGHLTLCQVVTTGTDFIYESSNFGFEHAAQSAAASGYNDFSCTVTSQIWPTSQYGLTISAHSDPTYASGVCLANGYLKIIQL